MFCRKTGLRGIRSLAGIAFIFLARATWAHSEPTSFLDLHPTAERLEAVVSASTTGLAHDLPEVEPGMLLQPEILQQQRAILAGNILARLRIEVDGIPLTGQLLTIKPVPDRQDLRLKISIPVVARSLEDRDPGAPLPVRSATQNICECVS